MKPVIKPSVLKEFFGLKTYKKGEDYYKRDVCVVLYIKEEIIHGQVIGTQLYETEADIYSFENSCSCPVGENCKHVVCLLLTFKITKDVPDFSIILDKLKNQSRKQLYKTMISLLSIQPSLVAEINHIIKLTNKNVKDKEKLLSKEDENRLIDESTKLIEMLISGTIYGPDWVKRFSSFLKSNSAFMTKSVVYFILECIQENEEELEIYLYDHVLDKFQGKIIYYLLAEYWSELDLRSEDFVKFDEIHKKSSYTNIDYFLKHLSSKKVAPQLKDKFIELKELLNYELYHNFLLNSGNKPILLQELQSNENRNLNDNYKFKLLKSIDSDMSTKFAQEKNMFDEIIKNLWNKNDYTAIVEVFKKIKKSKEKKEKLSSNLHVLELLLSTLNLLKDLEEFPNLIKDLFLISLKGKKFEICARIALQEKSQDFISELIPIKIDFLETDPISVLKILQFSKTYDSETTKRELKKILERIITNEAINDSEIFLQFLNELKSLLPFDGIENILKGLYSKYNRKRSFWSNLRYNGYDLKMRKGKIFLNGR